MILLPLVLIIIVFILKSIHESQLTKYNNLAFMLGLGCLTVVPIVGTCITFWMVWVIVQHLVEEYR